MRALSKAALSLAFCGSTLALGTVFVSAPAFADITGKVCVSDGSHLVINGRRNYGKCVGGTPVVLANVEVPPLEQKCGDPHGCGIWAAFYLTELVKGRDVTCAGNAKDAEGNLVAVCSVDGKELNRSMVELGWGLPVSIESPYLDAMREAQQKKRGLWNQRFEPPAKWRGAPVTQ